MEAIRVIGSEGRVELCELGPSFEADLLAAKASEVPVALMLRARDLTELVGRPELAHLLVKRQPSHPRSQIARALVGQLQIPFVSTTYRYPKKALFGTRKILTAATRAGDRNVFIIGVAEGVFTSLAESVSRIEREERGSPTASARAHLSHVVHRNPLPENAEEIVASRFAGVSESACEVRALILEAAVTDPTVLIEGETGTGKENAARLIHELSPRRAGKFIAVNVSAIASELFESEMFGAEPGSFTGCTTRRDGFFIEANGGTLFLDEMQDLALSHQPKLLRAIEFGVVRRVGGTDVRVDVRIIAAANEDLEAMVTAGRFRRDLLTRLRRSVIKTPSLRDHHQDLRVLAEHVWGSLQGSRGFPLSEDIHQELGAYRWDGNVRELGYVLEDLQRKTRGNTAPTCAALLEVVKHRDLKRKDQATGTARGKEPAGDPVHERPRVSLGHLERTAEVLRRFKQALRAVVIDGCTDPETLRQVRIEAEKWLAELDELSNYPARYARSRAWSPMLEVKGKLRAFIQSLERQPNDARARWHAALDDELKTVIRTLIDETERVYVETKTSSHPAGLAL